MTPTSKPTPGPWHVDIGHPDDAHVINAKGWHCLALVHGNEDDALAQQGLANARLIAAAPELLEALRELLTVQGCASATVKLRAEKAARAAIAKATGGES